ncbi:NitT/TauT family transport system substrate-binding protein [Crossiella equi]|uniref:NitT/TauT family transport system substrate-binding protein n=1 Tax=Crossiella equi TaxID=130796 RepID=A0ABS5AC00_9PSEU|nr:ABC transporter substrate-binding protein [Crossiella equi]MBP2474105.1 NitT/TauT family transport system substrate-binding protein [Crossiella equi]
MRTPRRRPRALTAALAAAALLVAAGCSRAAESTTQSSDAGPAAELRLGFFPNVTHAPALVGINEDKKFIAKELGATKLSTQAFNAGPSAVEALLAGSLDATFIGPNPTINAFTKSNGAAIRLVAGAATGGAQLVVKPGINGPADLKGRTIATPQLGGTQDVALRAWLAGNGLKVESTGGKDVKVANTENPQTFDAFRTNQLDGGWLPEPWSSRLVLEAGGKVLVDERDLWPGGRFPTTVLIVRTEFLQKHPATVKALLRGHVAATRFLGDSPAEAKQLVNAALGKYAGKPLPGPVLERAFGQISFTTDPAAGTFPKLSKDAVAAGVAKEEFDLKGLVDLSALNEALTAAGLPAVDAAGLDRK